MSIFIYKDSNISATKNYWSGSAG